MQTESHVQSFVPKIDSPEKVYELFHILGYQKDKVLDPSYKRKIDEFEFAKEEKEKVKDIYTVFNFDGKLQIFLIETKTLSAPFIRYLAKRLSDRYLRFLLILTTDYKEYTFVFPEFERVEEGKHKLKLTKLIFDREHPYHTDLLTISNIALTGDEENWRDIWKRWKDAFSVEKVTDEFFEDYTDAFFEAFNNKYSHPPYHSQDIKKILAVVPYLNGGLFQRNELDELPFHINDSLFEKVLNFFEKYNFTIREDFPLDIAVAVDPQMIGYVYESLSNVAEEIYERQDLGIFYTPTIEVDFMCRRSLVEYLLNHIASPTLPIPSPLAGEGKGEGYHLNKEWIYRLLFDEDKKDVEEYITKNQLWYRLEDVLDNLAVVDPACGSGAFLVGMLHVLA